MIILFKNVTQLFRSLILISIISLQTLSAQEIEIKSDILDETRKINIHLPENYEDSEERYMVIYMLDGGNDDLLTANSANTLHEDGVIPKVIVVGIQNIRRGYDLTAPYDKVGWGDFDTGNGDKFLAFIRDELIPEINKSYRTNEKKAFMGHSRGGAFTSYLMSQDIAIFNGYFIFSPALGMSGDILYTNLQKQFKTNLNLPKFIYLSVGKLENNRFQDSYKKIKDFFDENLPSKINFDSEETENADHMDNPKKAIPGALKLIKLLK